MTGGASKRPARPPRSHPPPGRSGAEGQIEVTRLQKFIEQGAYGEKSGRIAYTFDFDSLPEALEGMSWKKAESFNAADDLWKDAGLKDAFKLAIEKGCALVTRAG
jgi:hypothetical protein